MHWVHCKIRGGEEIDPAAQGAQVSGPLAYFPAAQKLHAVLLTAEIVPLGHVKQDVAFEFA